MLILTRNEDDNALIFGDRLIEVKILKIYGRQVRLGISAPKHIVVHRKEVFERIQKKKKEDINNQV